LALRGCLPLFQFLPREAKIALTRQFDLVWIGRKPEREDVAREVDSIRALSFTEMRSPFPDARIEREKFLGLT
jgi:hypothetical protein